jgi:diaminohydroxyphosphoribosylaminopyrimidine deaminase / 5-amino-6-(5-phosphoribosylamino)uracil reductase
VLEIDRAARRIWIATCLSIDQLDDVPRMPDSITVLTGLSHSEPDDPKNRVDVEALLETLAGNGVTRVLVEGGPTIALEFLAADLVDEVVIYRAPTALGDGGVPALHAAQWASFANERRWHATETRPLGPDTLTILRRMR